LRAGDALKWVEVVAEGINELSGGVLLEDLDG
jgi:hypothetical protein